MVENSSNLIFLLLFLKKKKKQLAMPSYTNADLERKRLIKV